MEKGEVFDKDNIRVVRPGLGIAPKYLEKFIGEKVNKIIKKGTRLNWKLLDG